MVCRATARAESALSWLSFVRADQVRWVFLSHDDHDHVGNLLEVLDQCPNATLVAAVGSAHGTATTGGAIDRGFELLRRAIVMEPAPLPGQADLDELLQQLIQALEPAASLTT